jgi:translation initiation factor 3 subunit A
LQTTALQAFQFCQKYERKSEFRRLCEMLRTHLSNLTKYANQLNAVSLNNPESLQLHMETRFAQLSTAVALELWQESSRTVDDLFGLMRQSRRPLKGAVMASYYGRMAQIFLVGENWLMHAFALKRQLQKSGNKLSPEARAEYVPHPAMLSWADASRD